MKKERLISAQKNEFPAACRLRLLLILPILFLCIGATHAFAKEISGYIRTSSDNGIGGVTVTFDNLGSTTTNSSGYYSKGIPNGWSGTVTPSRGGYSFAPVSRSYNGLTSNLSNQNYTGTQTQQSRSISGYVRSSSGRGIGGVTVAFDNGGGITTTDSSGYYRRDVTYGWSGTVTPSGSGYSFSPTSRSYNNLTSNLSSQNYTEVEEQVLLRLTVNRVGSGNVEVNPDRNFYPEGSFVTLTATADSGWVFSKWGGQLDSLDNPERISINSNMIITAVFIENVDNDVDDDGVSDKEENSGPGNGDGNNDGIPDSLQSNVGYLSMGNKTDYVALETPPGTSIKNCKTVVEPPDTNYPSDVDFLYGFFSFTVEDIGFGGSTSVKFYFSSEAAFNTYSRYGPTPDDPFDHWYEFIFNGRTGADINETGITLHFVDGERGDDDLTRDGKIVDIGGPGVKAMIFPESVSDLNAVGDDGYGCFVGCLP